MALLRTRAQDILGFIQTANAATIARGPNRETGQHDRECCGILAAFRQAQKPFPTQRDGFGDEIFPCVGAVDVANLAAGMVFNEGQDRQETGTDVAGHARNSAG